MKTVEDKLVMATDLLSEVQQAYHTLANMINKDRHQPLLWMDCQEESCKNLKEITEKYELRIASPLKSK